MDIETTQSTIEILPTKKTLHGSLYITIGRALAFLASFAVVTVMGRFVPREVVGSYNVIIATLSIVSILTLPGMTTALSRAVARGHDGTVRSVMKRRLQWGSIGFTVAAIIGIIVWSTGNHILGIGFLIAAPFVPLTDTFSNTAFSFWNGKKRFDKTAIITVLYYFGIAAFSIPIMIVSNNLAIIVLVVMIAQTLMGLIAYKTVVQHAHGTTDSESMHLGMHLTVMQALSIVAANIDRVITGILFGPAATAVYTFAVTPLIKAWQLVPIGVVSLPHLSEHEFTQHVQKKILRKTGNLFLISIPGTIALIAIAPIVYKIFFPLYPDSIGYFQLLATTLVFAPITLLRSSLTAFGKTKSLYLIEIINPAIKVILLITAGLTWGLPGIVYAIIAATIIDAIITTAVFLKTQKINS